VVFDIQRPQFAFIIRIIFVWNITVIVVSLVSIHDVVALG